MLTVIAIVFKENKYELIMDIKTRTTEIVKIFKTLNELKLGIECFEELDEFRSICNDFIRNGNPMKGQIKIVGTKRIICYNFDKKVECYLKYDESV